MTDQTIHLAEYKPYPFQIENVELEFQLHPSATRVRARLKMKRLAEAEDLDLMGEDLTMIDEPMINGKPVIWQALNPSLPPFANGIRIDWASIPDEGFTLETEVEINPEANTALEGLYMSNGMYCTQCEAEGFRKITYYPDRPDVMAPFSVRMHGAGPVLLSNGNPGDTREGFAEWYDPWPKPSYLFALVAGELVAVSDSFTTMSGREVALNIWVRPGDEDKCDFGMGALKRSMQWDEEVYGREYDLDVFNIVAVDDFNMGAMENKGLNIFNSKCVLASPETATDGDFARIEAIIAHEYFHNWTGNRITCRDWFQLCLKEGLTVFRDQQFSGDLRGHAVKRIEDVLALRARQFREDAGPLAHPVRPESFVEINNFYTATVYEKGAELIGMLKTLVGDDGYRAALDLYFERHDGEAATIEDWLKVFDDATGRDLSQFKRWYSQAGTPRIEVEERFAGGTFTLTLSQSTPPTPGQAEKQPQLIPVAVGLLSREGEEIVPTQVLELNDDRQSFTFEDLDDRPVPSILRGFSAPVILDRPTSPHERAFLLAHDTDPFNRWEAGRALSRETLISMLRQGEAPSQAYLDALAASLRNETLEPAFRALLLALPSEDDIAQALHSAGDTPDPLAIHQSRKSLQNTMATHLRPDLERLYEAMHPGADYRPDAEQSGKRALRNTCLRLLSAIEGPDRARAQHEAASNMTDELSAFACRLEAGDEAAAESFYAKWRHDRLVLDKWFMLQVVHAAPEMAIAKAEALADHTDFNWQNPNRFRALVGGLSAGNPAGFHDASGAGYRFLADWLIRLDAGNPQTAARMSTAFETWRRYDSKRQSLIRAELNRIAGQANLSRDISEMVGRMLSA